VYSVTPGKDVEPEYACEIGDVGHDSHSFNFYSVNYGRNIMTTLAGQKFLCFVGDDYEDLEVWYPKLRLIEAGAVFHLAGQEAGKKYIGKNGYPCVSDILIKGIDVATYDGLICAGGWMPDKLRRDPEVLRITREFAQAGKLVAAICHGGWMPISAGVYKGVKVTGSPGIKDDLVNAGAIFEDASVVVDRHFVSSRKPDDLPDFCQAILKVCGKT
jgi:protease I